MARPFSILELERNLGWCTSLSVYQRSNSQTIWHALQSLVSLSVVQTYIFHMRFSGMLRVNWGKLIDNNRGIIDKNPCVLVTILIRTMYSWCFFLYPSRLPNRQAHFRLMGSPTMLGGLQNNTTRTTHLQSSFTWIPISQNICWKTPRNIIIKWLNHPVLV